MKKSKSQTLIDPKNKPLKGMCKARLGVCWNKDDSSINNILYCKRSAKKDGYCTQHYKIHVVDGETNTKFFVVI